MSRHGTLPSVDRSPRATRANRLALLLLGLILLGGGGAGLALGLGAFGDDSADRAVVDDRVTDFVADNPWLWPAVAVAAAVLGLLALRWLFLQTTGTKVALVHLETDRARGTTVLSAAAVADAVAEEVRSYRGIDRADADLRGGAPELVLTAALDGRVSPGAVTTVLLRDAVPHTRQALDRPDLPVRIQLRLAARSRRDLR